MLKVTNTLTGKKEKFVPIHPDKVLMYVCGITPYDRAHIGHGRCYTSFDVLYRLLTFLGYQVKYVRNFTDIDDKLLKRAEQQLGDKFRYQEIANTFIKSYHDDMFALDTVKPHTEPRVTQNIDLIIDFIQGLIDKGHAYVAANGDVYFDVRSFKEYGKLSKRNIDELRAGARVDVKEEKKDPLDFALWKSEPEGQFWKSPWGYGRPGWHIECSALASYYLGDHIDIHAGGLDLVFPHHENEIAQSESLHGAPFARYWMHNGFVNMGVEKMSKSLGNIVALDDLLQKVDPMVVRYYYLSHHYRAPMEFSFELVQQAQKSYQKLITAFENIDAAGDYATMRTMPIVSKMLDFLCDDLNTPGMFGVIFEHLSDLKEDDQQAAATKLLLQQVLGLTLVPLTQKVVEITPEIQKLLDEREAARSTKNWDRADQIRDQLQKLGVVVQDRKN
ncbi:MAG TPA: cysteine--tRNA ligase [Candidatus Dependentiae bacterium]|nr:cysteine--tRNA ligase [Candidatus Dependentiae bacterium]HRQ63222.1 cysteine--tRNA ligase [Candidatus Dependentiae bacterium]